MHRRTLPWLFGIAIVGSLSSAAAFEHGTAGPWEMVRNDAGIEVFRRTVAGVKSQALAFFSTSRERNLLRKIKKKP